MVAVFLWQKISQSHFLRTFAAHFIRRIVNPSKYIKDHINQLIFKIRYTSPVYEQDVLAIRMSEEKIKGKRLKEFRKDFFSFTIKGKDDIYKYLFYILTLVLLVALPVMSLDVGVSDKEFCQQQLSEQLYEQLASGETPSDIFMNQNENFPSMDFLCYCIGKWLHIGNPYQLRHFIGALFAWGIILLAGGFLMKILNWRAAFFGSILLFISPRFLSQSFGNITDISFAFFYLLGTYEIFLFLSELPIVKWRRLIMIAVTTFLAVSVHTAGFVLLHYFFIFAILAYILSNPIRKIITSEYGINLAKLVGIVVGTIVVVYIADFLSPLHFLKISNVGLSNAVVKSTAALPTSQFLWEGTMTSSDTLGLSFLIKKMQITIPLVIIIGFFVHLFFIRTIVKETRIIGALLLYCAALYPLWSLYGTGSSVGDGWCIYLMVYPLLVMAAAAGFNGFISRVDDRYTNSVIVGGIFLLSFLPLRHVLFNQPCTGVYYNELAGGLHNVFGKYVIDENESVNRRACRWLLTHIQKNDERYADDTLPRIEIATDGGEVCPFFFRKDTNRIHVFHTEFANRDSVRWDYFISFIDRIPPQKLRTEWGDSIQPIKSLMVDNKPIAIIIKAEVDTSFVVNDTLVTTEPIETQNKVKKTSLR